MKKNINNLYKKSGVDVDAGYKVVDKIKDILNKDNDADSKNMGMFAGMFDLANLKLQSPVLFSSTDGVGTKVLLGCKYGIDNLGQDLVAMCVNDLICHGSKPLYFLDYIGTNKIIPDEIAKIIKSIVKTLNTFDCKLVGGETAEMSRVYHPKEFDLAGFAVGVCEKANIIWNNQAEENDVILGIEASGLHSNGYSLVHYLIENNLINLNDKLPSKKTVIQALLEPTYIYVNVILDIIKQVKVKGLANNTGGGVVENLARALTKDTDALININSYPSHELFMYLINQAKLTKQELFKSLNMGIGFFIIANKNDVSLIQKIIAKHHFKSYILGKVSKGNKKVQLSW